MSKNRYFKQEMCSFIGGQGQQHISQKHVLIVGMGALGSANAEMLVRSGIGTLSIVDRDYVEWSNLHRQQLYTEVDCKEFIPKAIAAKKRLSAINSEVTINEFVMDADSVNLQPLMEDVDVIIDATDNFDIRFILNDLSQKYQTPFIFGSCVASYGMTYTILPGKTPCLHCLLKKIPMTGATCDSVGVINPIVQLIAAYQVTECMKLLVGDEDSLRTTFYSIDLWKNQYYPFKVDKAKREDCPSCGLHPSYPYLQYESRTKTSILCGRNTVQLRPSSSADFSLDMLERKLKKSWDVKRNPFLLSCEIDSYRFVFFQDGRVFIHGVDNIQSAKKLYYSLIG
ncbi:MoeB/ThiF family adenylyltransferase [Ureibacillus sinduriensis]|uniref:Thiamine biosynthesis protein MoeB n=1 Tax=Ureibacillus sinduriensis BLB-1 = JCM 15800 TaxID=1384057 RepID=A0A0A3I192_9BACL|nr:MoeB/ThiF family adenylyltransferase [Ureibacillus sinduriensis]KGR78606.1 thiamine biosynthesis protein MoeB [Ureibacillus sinduriensis BLB-1 = JCM 15800]